MHPHLSHYTNPPYQPKEEQMMKKTLAAAALAAAFSGAAPAADLELYGVVDTGFTYTHGNDVDIDRFEMSTGNYAGSRFGLRGGEDLGNGVRINFILENGFQSDTGNYAKADSIFNRESQLFLTGSWGQLGFGRVGAFTSGSSSLSWYWDLEPFETGYIDAGIQASQVNVWRLNSNTIYYISPVFAGFKLGIQYSLTGTNDKEAQKQGDNNTFTNVALRWDGANARAILGFEMETYGDNETYYGAGGAADGTFTERRDNAYNVKLAGAWNVAGGPATLYAGASWYKNYNIFSDSTYDDDGKVFYDRDSSKRLQGYSFFVGGKYTIGQADLLAMFQYLDGENEGYLEGSGQDKDYKRYIASIGCHYHFSKRTMLYTIASYADGTGTFDDLDDGAATNRWMGHLGLTHFF